MMVLSIKPLYEGKSCTTVVLKHFAGRNCKEKETSFSNCIPRNISRKAKRIDTPSYTV
jgi:hypothetical protein